MKLNEHQFAAMVAVLDGRNPWPGGDRGPGARMWARLAAEGLVERDAFMLTPAGHDAVIEYAQRQKRRRSYTAVAARR